MGDGRHPGLLDCFESGAGLYDADRLAFREVLRSLQATVVKDGSLPIIKLNRRIGEDLDALAEIERNYDKEICQVCGRFESRAIELKRLMVNLPKFVTHLPIHRAVYRLGFTQFE